MPFPLAPFHPCFSLFTWSVPLTPFPAFSWIFQDPACWACLLGSLCSLPQVELAAAYRFPRHLGQISVTSTHYAVIVCLQFSLLPPLGDMVFQVATVSHSWIPTCSWKQENSSHSINVVECLLSEYFKYSFTSW